MAGLSYFEAGILAAVYRGVNTVRGLKELFHTVDPRVVEETVKRLEERGLVKRITRGRILKREELALTEAGVQALDEAMRMLREAAVRIEERSQGLQQASGAQWDLAAVLPLLILMGRLPPMIVYDAPEWSHDAGADEQEEGYSEWDDYGYDNGIEDVGL